MTQSADIDAVLARVRALADQWNDTPDYTPTDYDRGRVDQRHDMTGQLLEALDTRVTPPVDRDAEWPTNANGSPLHNHDPDVSDCGPGCPRSRVIPPGHTPYYVNLAGVTICEECGVPWDEAHPDTRVIPPGVGDE